MSIRKKRMVRVAFSNMVCRCDSSMVKQNCGDFGGGGGRKCPILSIGFNRKELIPVNLFQLAELIPVNRFQSERVDSCQSVSFSRVDSCQSVSIGKSRFLSTWVDSI